MLQPSRVKHTKVHRGRKGRVATRGTELAFGTFGLKALESAWLRANQLEAARRAITRYTQRGGKLWIRVFPHKPRTAKSSEVGMGGGRGSLSHFVAQIQSGRILLEIDGVSEEIAAHALRLASHKLPVKTIFVKRNVK